MDTSDGSTPGNGLRRHALGIGAITFFVVSAAGPLVAMAGGVPVSMLLGNGPAIPAMFVIVACILLMFAAGFTAMADHVRNAGGFYAFAARGLGGQAAGATAGVALFSYGAIQFGLYGLFGATASEFLNPHLGLHLRWWAYSFGALISIATLGYRQVDLSAKVLSLLVIGEYLVVLILDVAILAGGGSSGISVASFTGEYFHTGSFSIGLLFCFAAFIGFEATTIYVEEAKDPHRTIPIATYLSLCLIGGFYVFSSWCMVVGIGAGHLVPTLAGLPDPTMFLFSLSDRHVGPWLTLLMRFLFLTSIFAGLLAFHNAIARYFFALGRECLLPHRLGTTHAKHRSPHIASLMQSVTAFIGILLFALAQVDPVTVLFARVSAVGTLGVVTLMLIASTAVVAFFSRGGGRVWRTRVLPMAACVGLTFVCVIGCIHFDAMAGDASRVVRWMPILVLISAVIGAILARRLRQTNSDAYSRLGHDVSNIDH